MYFSYIGIIVHWMRNFKMPESLDDRLPYLESQQVEIETVRDLMLESLENGQKILDQYERILYKSSTLGYFAICGGKPLNSTMLKPLIKYLSICITSIFQRSYDFSI